MELHLRTINDPAEEISNETHELFAQKFIELDLDEGINNKRRRRIEAYRICYPDSYNETDGVLNGRATTLLRNERVSERIAFLYEERGTSLEAKVSWSRMKAEDSLLDIIGNEDSKDSDRIKAIECLNKMRGIDAAVIEEQTQEKDSVDDYFARLKDGMSHDAP